MYANIIDTHYKTLSTNYAPSFRDYESQIWRKIISNKSACVVKNLHYR